MQKIYIDVTNLTRVKFLTGIQRVVRNVSVELNKMTTGRICYLSYEDDVRGFKELDSDKFIGFIQGKGVEQKDLYTGKIINPKNMNPGDIFFDLDAVWNNTYKRSVLLPDLKRYGVKISVYVYDIIPITHPQYTHSNTRFNFMNYIGAYLQYADAIIVSAKSTLDAIYELCDKLGLPHVPGYVSWLGSDFSGVAKAKEDAIPKEVIEAANSKYILNIGTIEPRKNHTLLLDAFEQGLFDKDVKLIFAGKIGWNVEKLAKRIEEHPEKDKRFYHFIGLSDEAIEYLYTHAFMVAFPTFIEGFGLPIVESLERGTPVLASDVPVLREVGRDYCEYFDPHDPKAFIDVVSKLIENKDEYERLREKAAGFVSFTWKETAEKILEALDTLKIEEYKAKTDVSQMVILTARVEDITGTVPFIEKYMPFIDRLLLCCPDKVAKDMMSIKTDRIKIETLTDEEILKGAKLPEDHGTRNFFLRCLAMQSDKVDDVFIMSDDDYRPLEDIDLDVFVKDGAYRAYYCNELNEWHGVIGGITSYDRYIHRTRDFCNEHRYPAYQYSSHMPQIIDKSLYQEMISNHPGIEMMGLDEWSSYFNYVQNKYPNLVKSEPYVVLGWPGRITDWNMYVKPEKYLFENYYSFLYEKDEIFEGKSEVLTDNQAEENKEKIRLVSELTDKFFEGKYKFRDFCDRSVKENLEVPSFGIYCKDDRIEIGTPLMCELSFGTVNYLSFVFKGQKEGMQLQVGIFTGESPLVKMPFVNLNVDDINLTDGRFETCLICYDNGLKKGNFILVIRVEDGDKVYIKKVALKLV